VAGDKKRKVILVNSQIFSPVKAGVRESGFDELPHTVGFIRGDHVIRTLPNISLEEA
jgi:hypothetical protein